MSVGLGSHPFPAYRGDEPYLFASYAHRDGQHVYADLGLLHRAGYRIWYDEGITPTATWYDEIARALDGCTAVMLFLSPVAVASTNVLNETYYALELGKPIVVVERDRAWLPAELQGPLAECPTVSQWQAAETDWQRHLWRALPLSARDPATVTPDLRRLRLSWFAAAQQQRQLESDELAEVAMHLRALGDEGKAEQAEAAAAAARTEEGAGEAAPDVSAASVCPLCGAPVEDDLVAACASCSAGARAAVLPLAPSAPPTRWERWRRRLTAPPHWKADWVTWGLVLLAAWVALVGIRRL